VKQTHRPHGAPDLSLLQGERALIDALVYYAQRASLVNPNGASRKQLRALLREHDLRVVEILARLTA